MMKRLIGWLVLLPTAGLVIMLAVLNRGPMMLQWNPLEAGLPSHGVTLPIYVVLLIAFTFGALVGGFIVWNGQRRFRRSAKENRAQARTLAAEVQELKTTTGRVAPLLPAPR